MKSVSQETVALAMAGDRDALCELLDYHGPQVARRLVGQLNGRWRGVLDVEDVMQVTFLEVFLRIDQFDSTDSQSFTAWLTRIAENNLRDAIRGLQSEKRPHPARRVTGQGVPAAGVGLIEIACGSTTTSQKAARAEMGQIVDNAISELPDDYAEVIRLYDLEGISAPEVGQRMKRSRGAVHMLHARALVRLKELLGSQSQFFSDCP